MRATLYGKGLGACISYVRKIIPLLDNKNEVLGGESLY